MGWLVMIFAFAVGFARLAWWWALGIGLVGGAVSLVTTVQNQRAVGVYPPLSHIVITLIMLLAFALVPYWLGRLHFVMRGEAPPAK